MKTQIFIYLFHEDRLKIIFAYNSRHIFFFNYQELICIRLIAHRSWTECKYKRYSL